MFHAVCKTGHRVDGAIVECELDTDQPFELVAHMRDVHKRRTYNGDPIIARTRRGWSTPKRKPFEPGRFDVGAWVTWESKGSTHTGQVWALRGPHTRWVADGTTFHLVYADQLVAARDEGRSAA